MCSTRVGVNRYDDVGLNVTAGLYPTPVGV